MCCNMFKKNQISFLAIVVIIFFGLIFLLLKSNSSSSSKIPSIKLAIVDGARIKSESKAFQKVVELERIGFDKINSEVKEKYKYLQNLLKKSKDIKNSSEQRLKYKKQFDHEFSILEPKIQKRKDEIRKRDAIWKQRLNDTVLKITNNLAKKYNLNVILNANVFDTMTVFYASENIDITNEVIELIDDDLKDIIAE